MGDNVGASPTLAATVNAVWITFLRKKQNLHKFLSRYNKKLYGREV